ncbi:hypothetical protein GH714_039172 [Hevea brasiliensis]|uniref:Uncharacterized protein n=2 Tax=Hevea brasiliensis TaxID=3981 RepID=A0A6A6KR48_HEVBR|nr:hypothetical protein GH714_039172 [Hevea brasiliensis]
MAFDNVSKGYGDAFSYSMSSDHGSIWSKQPYEQFGPVDKSRVVGSGIGNRSNSSTQETVSLVDSEAQLLKSFRCCIVRLLKLEGSDWLFGQNDGTDEDLIDRVAERERCLYEVETREINRMVHMGESQYSYSDRKPSSVLKNDEAGIANILVSSVPNCGEGCVWRADLITSFGVWCIHRILDLSLMESRPELWGKYTYVLNRLQGIIDLAFSKPRSPMSPCFCLQLSAAYQRRSSPPVVNGMLPPAAKPGRGKCTTAATLFDLIKDVEIAISCRKGRSGTAAGDVAFPKGKENLASVLKRYKRRLSSKLNGNKEGCRSKQDSVHRHFSHGHINGRSYATDPLRQSAYELYIRFPEIIAELGVNVSSSRQRSELGGTADCCLFMVLLRKQKANPEMGYVIVVSLPLILFIIILALACYLLGRNWGRRQAAAARIPQYYGPSAPPPRAQPPPMDKPSEV